MEPWRVRAAETCGGPPGGCAGERELARVRRLQSGGGRYVQILGRAGPEHRRGQDAVLVLGDPLFMPVPMDQSLREAGPLRAVPWRFFGMLMVDERMRPQPEQLRHCCQGKEKENGGESLAQHHARIVIDPGERVKRTALQKKKPPPEGGGFWRSCSSPYGMVRMTTAARRSVT